jgi:uracil-DNA glycosylase
MKTELEIDEIKQKLFDKLEPSGWGRVFKSFIFSSEFDDILIKLYKLSIDGKRFTPTLRQIFRAFEECPYNELQIVIVGQDPYPQVGVADGIAFSCSNTNRLQPSLRYILNEVNKTVYNGEEISTDVDLKRWSNQGILLLNTALTTEVSKIGAHYDIWKPFTAYLLDWLNNYNPGLIYVYMGKKAEEWSVLTSDNTTYKFTVKHPASAAYSGSKWDSDNIFMRTRAIVKKISGKNINW